MSLGGSKLKKRAATRRKQMKMGKSNKPQQQQKQKQPAGGKRQGAGKKQFRKAAAMAQMAPQHQQHPTGKLTRAQKKKLAQKQQMNAGVEAPMMMGRRGGRGGGGGDPIQTLKQRLAALERTVVTRRGGGTGAGRGGGGGGAMSPRELQLKNRVADLERELRASRESMSPAIAFAGGLRTGAAFAMVADRIPEHLCIAPNTCLGHAASRLLERFESGLAECGIRVTELSETALEDLSLGFHGTGSPQAILMDGFDPAKRNRQFKGRGEYFSVKWDDAERFARRAVDEGNGDEPTVLVTLLIKSQASNVQLDNDPSTSWLCVNNPMGRNSPTFCLPVCYVRLNNTNVALPDCPPYDGGRQQPSSRIVEYSADRNQWVRFPRSESRRISNAWNSGSRCVVTIGNQRYVFDWQAGRIVSDNGDWYHFQMQQ